MSFIVVWFMAKKGEHASAQWYLEGRHKEAVMRKHQRVLMYRTLIDAWEQHDDTDPDYINDLKRRLRSAEQQLKAMKP
jgi:hypothetical protein